MQFLHTNGLTTMRTESSLLRRPLSNLTADINALQSDINAANTLKISKLNDTSLYIVVKFHSDFCISKSLMTFLFPFASGH